MMAGKKPLSFRRACICNTGLFACLMGLAVVGPRHPTYETVLISTLLPVSALGIMAMLVGLASGLVVANPLPVLIVGMRLGGRRFLPRAKELLEQQLIPTDA